MEIASGLIKLLPDSEKSIEEWQCTMSSSISQVNASLINEGVETESWFNIDIEGSRYLLWYMRAESMEQAIIAFKKSTASIDKFHLETLTKVSEPNGHIIGKPLLDFSVAS